MSDDKQAAYAAYRQWHHDQWYRAEEEDFCARKELTPGTYKPLAAVDQHERS